MQTQAVSPVFAGIDVGAEELVLVLRKPGGALAAQGFLNTQAGRGQLVRKLARLPGVTVCLEATGVYSMDLCIALFDAGVRLMVLNPQASHNFAKVLGKHSKTDAVDADTLAQYAERMPFQAWARPSDALLTLRTFSRRIHALTQQKAAAKNQLHALGFAPRTPHAVAKDLALAITQLEQRLETLNAQATAFIAQEPTLSGPYALLQSITGVAQVSAIALLGELLLIPKGLTHAQWVKFAGLDPKHFRSGTSVDKKARLSKSGNRYIRAALYMPALSAKAHDPYVKAFFEHLIANGKTPLQAVCAVMRKLLHAMHGMLTHNQPFDNARFYATQVSADTKTAQIR
jgi:transposase